MIVKKRIAMAAAGVLAAVLVAGSAGYAAVNAGEKVSEPQYDETEVKKGKLELTFEEEGTTQISAISQIPELSAGSVKLEIEEVYVEAGDTVEAGDALMKLTDESVQEAAAYYEEVVAQAQSALKTAQTDYESGALEAGYTRQDAQLALQNAQTAYDTSLSEMDLKLQEKKDAYEEASEQLAEYQSNLDNNTYYTNAGIEEKEAAVTEAQESSTAAGEALEDAQKNSKEAQEKFDAILAALEESAKSETDEQSEEETKQLKKQVLEMISLYEALESADQELEEAQKSSDEARNTLQQAQETLQQATEAYEQNTQTAEAKVTELTGSLGGLEAEYEETRLSYEADKLAIQNSYDAAVLEGNSAETVYQSALAELQSAVDDAQEALDTVKEQQDELLSLENGVITAEQAGTLAAVSYEPGDFLIANVAAVSYYDTTEISISVEVEQENIAKVSVGDEVEVSVSGVLSSLSGTVESIASSATADGSASKVTYAVVVAIDNTEGQLSSGLSASLTFRYGTLEDVTYVALDAIEQGTGTSGTALLYDENGEVKEITVTVGTCTENYIVVTEGLEEGDICLIETGGTK